MADLTNLYGTAYLHGVNDALAGGDPCNPYPLYSRHWHDYNAGYRDGAKLKGD